MLPGQLSLSYAMFSVVSPKDASSDLSAVGVCTVGSSVYD
jgi:hypothetical protein